MKTKIASIHKFVCSSKLLCSLILQVLWYSRAFKETENPSLASFTEEAIEELGQVIFQEYANSINLDHNSPDYDYYVEAFYIACDTEFWPGPYEVDGQLLYHHLQLKYAAFPESLLPFIKSAYTEYRSYSQNPNFKHWLSCHINDELKTRAQELLPIMPDLITYQQRLSNFNC